MHNPPLKPSFLELPPRRPKAQRQYTASPPKRHDCTPRTSHGFLPLRTSSPLSTVGDRTTERPSFNYFSLPRKESLVSPPAVQYESHGFIPLCSVAVVEKKDEAQDYFSIPVSHEQVGEENVLSTPDVMEVASVSDTPSPRILEFASTSHIPISQLIHPTGSPLLDRDFIQTPDQPRPPHLKPIARSPNDVGINETTENMVGPEYDSNESQGWNSEDALMKLEHNNQIFETTISNLEKAVFFHLENEESRLRYETNGSHAPFDEYAGTTPCCSSFKSSDSGSAYFNDDEKNPSPTRKKFTKPFYQDPLYGDGTVWEYMGRTATHRGNRHVYRDFAANETGQEPHDEVVTLDELLAEETGLGDDDSPTDPAPMAMTPFSADEENGVKPSRALLSDLSSSGNLPVERRSNDSEPDISWIEAPNKPRSLGHIFTKDPTVSVSSRHKQPSRKRPIKSLNERNRTLPPIPTMLENRSDTDLTKNASRGLVSSEPVPIGQILDEGPKIKEATVSPKISPKPSPRQPLRSSPGFDTPMPQLATPQIHAAAIPKRERKFTPLPISSDDTTLYKIACKSQPRALAACLQGRTFNIVNTLTGQIYVSDVPERMLLHFCGAEVVQRLAPSYGRDTNVLEIPASEADAVAIARVLRFMKRCCLPLTHQSSGDLRVPPNIRDGMETIRACRVLGLIADAKRIEDVVVWNWLGRKGSFMCDSDISLIWNSYFGQFRESALGDAIVWAVLNEATSDAHASAEEMRCMLDQPEFETLRVRVKDAIARREWKRGTRGAFLDSCQKNREKAEKWRERRRRERLAIVERVEEHRERLARENGAMMKKRDPNAVVGDTEGEAKWEPPSSWAYFNSAAGAGIRKGQKDPTRSTPRLETNGLIGEKGSRAPDLWKPLPEIMSRTQWLSGVPPVSNPQKKVSASQRGHSIGPSLRGGHAFPPSMMNQTSSAFLAPMRNSGEASTKGSSNLIPNNSCWFGPESLQRRLQSELVSPPNHLQATTSVRGSDIAFLRPVATRSNNALGRSIQSRSPPAARDWTRSGVFGSS
ncbi:hypothetical protein CC86DRAFT_467068 [Ophiobolus disseminans]|uniref:Uncharacterized protein n=1 Tax=Ophiobolus disseminans TaxID=1469910 RepID=A0A6A7A1B1_9PLEO|nr:hypothetical protein CC86DRAFT_467068 [Ophiobolus disseminans]